MAKLFAGLKFHLVGTGSEVDIPRRAELAALLRQHGGEVLERLEALKLPPDAVMRLVVDPFAVPDKDTGVARACAARRGASRLRRAPFAP